MWFSLHEGGLDIQFGSAVEWAGPHSLRATWHPDCAVCTGLLLALAGHAVAAPLAEPLRLVMGGARWPADPGLDQRVLHWHRRLPMHRGTFD